MENHTSKQADATSKPPVAKLRLGLLNANIWQRTSDKGTFYSVTFENRYKDGQGKWQSSHNFQADDLLLLAKLADQAHTEITNLRARVTD